MKQYKILGAKWFTPPAPTWFGVAMHTGLSIGIIAVESYKDGSWKCYVGYGLGVDERADEQNIAAHGMPFGNGDAAAAFFGHLDPELYRY